MVMIRARESIDQSFKNIKSQTTNTSEKSIDAIGTKMSKMRLKEKSYGCRRIISKTSNDVLPHMQSAIPVAKLATLQRYASQKEREETPGTKKQ